MLMDDLCFFVTDLHGKPDRYHALFDAIRRRRPATVLIGGDILPFWMGGEGDFIDDILLPALRSLRDELKERYPKVFVILGNDDPKSIEPRVIDAERQGLLTYLHMKTLHAGGLTITGYSYIPPTPFMLKDWEKYDVGVYVDPGCVHPTEGYRSVEPDHDPEYTNIASDLKKLSEGLVPERAVFLFHSPPYGSGLDRAALDGKMVDYVPLDVHVGSIAIQRFIEGFQPLLTLHGHIHESSSITGVWKERIGRTVCMNGAWNGPELCLLSFSLSDPWQATRELI